jgi:DNA polymerase-3 subunit beta
LGQTLFTVTDDVLELHGTNLDLHAIQRVQCEAQGSWSFVTGGGRLRKLIKGMTGPVFFTVDPVNETLTIKVGEITLMLRAFYDPIDWPALDLGKPEKTVTFGEAALHQALQYVMASISTDVTRYYLNGIFWPSTPKGRFVSTDGHRMALYDFDAPAATRDTIIPRDAASLLQGMSVKGGNGEFKVTQRDNSVLSISKGDQTLHTKTIDGTYPDYTRVIPKKGGKIDVVVGREAAQRIASVVSAGTTRICKISPSRATISAQLDDSGGITIPLGTAETDAPDIGFNPYYLRDLTRIAGDLRLQSHADGGPARLTNEDTPGLILALMPMRV